MRLDDILTLAQHGPDTYVGTGPQYPWGGLYGGQIVAQALLAAAETAPPDLTAHSLRAYFIRRGDQDEPVRYEVDRIRNGRSFATRRVVARQAIGAILNLEASFQAPEESEDLALVTGDEAIPGPETLETTSWTTAFERAFVPPEVLATASPGGRQGGGRAAAWLRTSQPVAGEPGALGHLAALAYLSDDLPTDAVVRAHPVGREPEATRYEVLFSASLDHTIWFHRPMRADAWHLHDFTCHAFVGGRGLTIGHVFDAERRHVATVAQEVLLRDNRRRGA